MSRSMFAAALAAAVLAGTALAGYVPFKAFRFPEIYLKWTAWLCFALAALAVILPRMRGPRRPDGDI